jgi:hypothetical protein
MKHLPALFCVFLFGFSAAAQDLRAIPPRPLLPPPPQPGGFVGGGIPGPRDNPPAFSPFDLEFPGGTPADLQAHIEGATGKPLNVIIPSEHADAKLPPLKMKNITVPQLFEAINQACRKVVPTVVGYYASAPGAPQIPRYEERESSMGFRFPQGVPMTEATVWQFFRLTPPVIKEPMEAPICRFFNLEEHLNTYKIEDITTAMQTGYKMLGDTNPPTMTFHKDTKLLIAVGDPGKLKLIEAMLKELAGSKLGFNPTGLMGQPFRPAPQAKPPKGADNAEP